MKRSAEILALGLALLTGLACGKKGPLRPPLSPAPQAVQGLAVHQRGGSVVLEWTNPERFIDGRPLGPIGRAELWVLEPGPGEAKQLLKLSDFEARARLVRRISPAEFRPPSRGSSGKPSAATFVYPVPGVIAAPRIMAFSVRVLDGRQRPSKLCAPVLVELRVCPLPPEIAEVRVFEDRIEVSWAPPTENIDKSAPARVSGYTVYRSEGRGIPEKSTASPISGLVFEDRSFSFGVPYSYVVRACAAGTDPCLESDDSAPREVVPLDTFPPDPPSGLIVLAGTDVISLSWQAGREEDLAGCKIWRKEEEASGFVLLTSWTVPGNSFTDRSAEKGKVYVYAVSALDKTGNESAKTESGPVSLKGNGA